MNDNLEVISKQGAAIAFVALGVVARRLQEMFVGDTAVWP